MKQLNAIVVANVQSANISLQNRVCDMMKRMKRQHQALTYLDITPYVPKQLRYSFETEEITEEISIIEYSTTLLYMLHKEQNKYFAR